MEMTMKPVVKIIYKSKPTYSELDPCTYFMYNDQLHYKGYNRQNYWYNLSTGEQGIYDLNPLTIVDIIYIDIDIIYISTSKVSRIAYQALPKCNCFINPLTGHICQKINDISYFDMNDRRITYDEEISPYVYDCYVKLNIQLK